MADYAISNVPRRVVYANSGVGPYAFTFEILSQTDISVYRGSTLLTLTTDYSVTINANGTGSVTLVTAGTGNITIVGAKNIQRTSDFTTGGDLFANTLNDELDNQTIFVQQVAETAERGLKAPVTDPTDIAMTLPAKDGRKGKVLAFDSTTGNPVAGPALDSVTTVIEQSANINTVADNIADVIIVADNTSNINSVASNTSNINTVAGASSNVTTVATNIANVNAVGADLLEPVSEINTVAVDIANVNTVGTNIANVNSVASNSTNINTVATNIASVNTVASNIGEITDKVSKTSNTGSAIIPKGTTAQRDGTPTDGYFRYNSDLDSFEGYVDGAWGGVGGAQAGGVIYENNQTITSNYTLTTNKNGMSVGAISINSGVAVTVPSGSTWVIL